MALHPELLRRVKEFLPTLRLGVDFGEKAGGIALVRSNNIIHVETYVDFHDATLEDRRNVRRQRRTRNAKKMRLARLRSWILRQFVPPNIPGVEIKNGKARLPDPYRLMGEKKYQTLPGFYNAGGKAPDNAPTWVDVARRGETDAEGFVIALTHIFKKRGYKYDDRDFEELSNSNLQEFLDSCCLLEESGVLADVLKEEVERRNSDKLKEAYRKALVRQPERRKALPRQLKENYLKEVVTQFGMSYGLDSTTVARWQKELMGLLNKVVRPARYDNRMRSGCSWCGKRPPRLKKPDVRELNFKAAVENLRVKPDERLRWTRPLTPEEKEPLLSWHRRRIEEREGRFAFPKGPKVPVTERAPSEDNIRKYLESIRAEKKWMKGSKGRPKFDIPMLPQLVDFLNRSSSRRGRAKLCIEHLKMAAEGKTMKDADVEWQTLRNRRAPNPRREQHDARVLRRIEDILFIKGKYGESAWRHGPVSFITLEIPKPVTEQPAKGQQAERKDTTIRQRLHAETGGRCIYCWNEISVESTEMDHIVSRARGGPDIQVNRIAACHDCNHPDKGKGDRLPSEWLNGRGWQDFKERVEKLPLDESKKQILLLEKGESFPEDPTPFARVGARSKAFVAELIALFKRYGIEPPTLNYTIGKPHIQCVGGELTRKLRISYLYNGRDAEEINFPEKDRTDLYNHAQDAALLASVPPHTWRSRIFIEQALRPCAKRSVDGKMLTDSNGRVVTELRMRPGVALLDLAPDWAGFVKRWNRPMVKLLGSMRINWKHKLMDLSFYQRPKVLDESKLRIRKSAPGGRSQTVEAQKGGLVVQVPHADGTTGIRKVQIKPVQSVAAIIWHDPKGRKGNVQVSLERPRAIRKFVKSLIEPSIPKGAIRLGRLERMQTVPLEGVFYRVKELSENGIIVIPENAVTDALAMAMNIPKTERKTPPERRIGKKELLALFDKGVG